MNLRPKSKSFLRRAFLLKSLAAIIFLVSILTIFGVLFIKQKAFRVLDRTRADSADNPAEIPFKKVPHPPHRNDFVKIWQNARNVRDVVKFKNSYFAATGGGLVEFDETGSEIRHFTVSDGLPESDLNCLAVFQSKLFVGSQTKGLIAFDGENFERYELENHRTDAITAFFTDSQKLLIGTFSGGVLEFNGRRFIEILNENDKTSFKKITRLLEKDGRFFIGTFDKGLWIKENGVWKQFTNADGLPSNRVVGIEQLGENIFVAADLGVAKTEISQISQPKPFQNSLILPALSGIAEKDGKIFLTRDDGDLFSLDAENVSIKPENLKELNLQKPENLTNARLIKTGNGIFLGGSQGVWMMNENSSFRQFDKNSNANSLSNNMISALALEANERLWIGTFRNGIDVFSTEGKKLRRIENESVREINFLLAASNTVRAATSAGVFDFDKNFTASKKSDELTGKSVTHIAAAPEKSSSVYATNRGVMFSDEKNLKALTTVNGLPGNNIYATLYARNVLFVGTLNGLAQIENNRVVRVFKDSNSNLKQNWVTALCFADGRIFIGTYGGGVFELLTSGEIRSFAPEIGKFVVNPNALFSDGERLYAGTLDGVRILDLTSQKWSLEKDFLPAETVLSVTGNRENIFFGTTNGIAQVDRRFWDSAGKLAD